MNTIKKTVYTLNIDNYEPAITALTFPLLRAYAKKINADFQVITERKFTLWPIVMEKLQIYDLNRDNRDDWSIYIDADALISPESPDFTAVMGKDFCAHNGRDFNGVRWDLDDPYFKRDGRWIGSCNWLTIASDWTRDLWHKPELSFEETKKRIHVTIGEHNSGQFSDDHLVDDYTLSRNIARFGLHFTTLGDLLLQAGLPFRDAAGHGVNPYAWHQYAIPREVKLKRILAVLGGRQGIPVFEEDGEIIANQHGQPVVRMPDGRIVESCGQGWSLLSQSEVQAFRVKWDVR